MMKLDDLLNEWKEDSIIDEILLDESSLKIACLHHKYVQYLADFKKQLRFLKQRKKDFPIPDRRGSTEYAEIEELLAQTEDAIDSIDRIIYAINQMSFNIKNTIQWRMWVKGVDVA